MISVTIKLEYFERRWIICQVEIEQVQQAQVQWQEEELVTVMALIGQVVSGQELVKVEAEEIWILEQVEQVPNLARKNFQMMEIKLER